MIVKKRSWFSLGLFLMKDYNKELPFVGKFLFWSSLPVVMLELARRRRPGGRMTRWLLGGAGTGSGRLRPVYECFFTSDRGLRDALTVQNRLTPATKPFTDFINLAEESLYLCFFSITSNDVISAVREARRRGVQVTVITDCSRGLHDGFNSFIKKLEDEGVVVLAKKQKEESLMHHKFMIRDSKMLFITSMNPTQSAASGSFDNFFITNDKLLLDPFTKLFNNLVREFSY